MAPKFWMSVLFAHLSFISMFPDRRVSTWMWGLECARRYSSICAIYAKCLYNGFSFTLPADKIRILFSKV